MVKNQFINITSESVAEQNNSSLDLRPSCDIKTQNNNSLNIFLLIHLIIFALEVMLKLHIYFIKSTNKTATPGNYFFVIKS